MSSNVIFASPNRVVNGLQQGENWVAKDNGLISQTDTLSEHSKCGNAIDHVVVATVDCLTGTFVKELEEWGIPAGTGQLYSDVQSEVEEEGHVPVIRRIHVNYLLRAEENKRDTAERIHGYHTVYSPLARSLAGGIEVTTSLQIEPA